VIDYIEVHNIASYRQNDPQRLENTAALNFLFGGNGSGKTTISRLINDPLYSRDSKVSWKRDAPLETLVYNRDFVTRNFVPSAEIKGIFTLGKQASDTVQQITDLAKESRQLTLQIGNYKRTRDGEDGTRGENGRLRDMVAAFTDRCWELKVKHDRKLQGAFVGVRSDRVKFREKLLEEKKSNKAEIRTLDYLETKAESIFNAASGLESLVPVPNSLRLVGLETSPVLQRVIVGQSDVDIAGMIRKLSNSDWVRQGVNFFEINDEICPFCQQPAPESLAKSLEEYFDDSFIRNSQDVEQLCSEYRLLGEQFELGVRKLLTTSYRGLDMERLRALVDSFRDTVALNVSSLDIKKKEPSRRVTLTSVSEVVAQIENLVGEANSLIQAHNKLVANRGTEKVRLTSEIWKFLLEDVKTELAAYEKQTADLGKALHSLDEKMSAASEERSQKDAEIRKLERQTTSIEPTINEINRDLARWGFSGFSLAKSQKNGFYKLVRQDGTSVDDTLSEGEKSFVTFLYFYRLLKGSNSETGTVNNRVVVIDDPVSSLDSNILYVVSSLIKSLFQELRDGTGQIKQLFVLTHNVYFHKEVTYKAQGACKFWVIRKLGSGSKIESHSSNPVKSSYELLWAELRRADPSKTSIQNTMRRIVETYFTHFGGMPFDHLEEQFEGQDQIVYKSLLSWMHDGSHAIHDDLHVSSMESGVDEFFRVFEKIFTHTEHKAHYDMMMRVNPISISHAP
jgi:wobble nucleotide-excising tRNase